MSAQEIQCHIKVQGYISELSIHEFINISVHPVLMAGNHHMGFEVTIFL